MPNAKGRWRRSAGPSTRCEGGQADLRHRPRGAGLSGPGRGGAGRAGGGRSRSKMAAQRRSLLQSVSGIFPPSVHTHPPGGCEAVPGLLLTRPPRCRVGRGRFPRRGAVGRCSAAPCAASGQGVPGCGAPCAVSGAHAGLPGRSAAHGGPQVAGGPWQCCGLRGAPLWQGAASSAGRAGDGGPGDVSNCGCTSRPQCLVLVEQSCENPELSLPSRARGA